MHFAELGTSLFEIAQSLFALEGTLIWGANEQFKKKREERRAKWQNQILSGLLMSDIRKKERINSKSDVKYRTVINDAKQRKYVVFFTFTPL